MASTEFGPSANYEERGVERHVPQPGRNTSTMDKFQDERKRRGPIIWMLLLAFLGTAGFLFDLVTI